MRLLTSDGIKNQTKYDSVLRICMSSRWFCSHAEPLVMKCQKSPSYNYIMHPGTFSSLLISILAFSFNGALLFKKIIFTRSSFMFGDPLCNLIALLSSFIYKRETQSFSFEAPLSWIRDCLFPQALSLLCLDPIVNRLDHNKTSH